jgi:Domain of unknown function (DUF4397)
MLRRLHPALRLFAVAALSAALTGCQSIAGIQPVSQVRVINASPDAPPLDIHQTSPSLPSPATLYNLGFGTVTSYIPVDSGTYLHSATTAGTQQQLAQVRGTLLAGNQYTVLTGNIAANLQMTILKDQSTPAPSGQVALRILDQATHSGAVDLYLLPPGAAPITVAPLISSASFGSNTGYINVPAGTYSLLAYPAGAIPLGAVLPTYTGSQATYSSGSARTILLIDAPQSTTPAQPADPALQILTANDYDPTN